MNKEFAGGQRDARGRIRTARRVGSQNGQSLSMRRSWFADISITAANVAISASAKTDQGIAGETITAGQTLYKNDSTGLDGRLYKADSNASPVTANCVGIATHGAAAGQPLTYVYDDPDFTPGGTLSLSVAADSGVYVLSGTAGGIAPMDDLAAGMYPVVLGVAKSTTKMVLKIVKQVSGLLVA